jgi:flagellin-like hook-associated protein FlgL
MTRVATFALHNLTLFHTLNTQSRAQDLQIQLATGKKSQPYSGVSQDSQRLVSIETQRAQVGQFLGNISTAGQRLELMDLGIASIEELARDFRNLLDNALDGPAAFAGDLQQFASDARLMIVDLLNSQDGGRYLFGGGRVDRPPVDITSASYTSTALIQSDGVTADRTFYEAYYEQVQGNTLPFAQGSFYEQIFFDKNGVAPTVPFPADPANPTLAEFVAEDPALWDYYVDRLNSTQMLANPKLDYYQGDAVANVVRADDDLEVSYDVRADHPAFQQILSALDAVANLPNGDTSDPNERAIVAKAEEMITDAIDSLAGGGFESLDQLRATVARARNNLIATAERHENFSAYAEGVINELEGIDPTEVIVKLQSEQQALEASYASLARLQSLSLLDFL